MKAITTTAATVLTLAMLAGCGSQGTLVSSTAQNGATMDAASASGLKKAFTRIHKAIFTTMDADKNGWLDEYEAGKHMSMRDFKKADKKAGWGSANRLSRTEFVDWATTTFLWFNDTPDSFAARFRKDLGKVFSRLDANDDLLLVKNELSLRDLAKLRLTFEYDKLNIKVPIKKVDMATFSAADRTGDGKLSQAEFEDLYLDMVVLALGGDGSTPPAPPAPAEEPAQP